MTAPPVNPTPSADLAPQRARWSPVLTASWWMLGLTPVAFLGGAAISMGDPATALGLAAGLAIPAVLASLGAFADIRRWYALIPAVILASIAAAVLVLARMPGPEPEPVIEPDRAALSVSFDETETPECLITPQSQVFSAGPHTLIVTAPAGTRVAVVGPAPSTREIVSYVRPDDSDGVGPVAHLVAGTYTVTCELGGRSSSTELPVAP